MEKTIKLLEKQFYGIGEVKSFRFTQKQITDVAYMYEVCTGGANIHFEVFKRKNAPVCIDFANRVYSETEFKEVYPKSKAFGFDAWTFNNEQKAICKLNSLNN